jgi:hypothetical protein
MHKFLTDRFLIRRDGVVRLPGRKGFFACFWLLMGICFMPTYSGLAKAGDAMDGGQKFTKTRFFRYLMEPDPQIEKAVFRKEVFSPTIPRAARVQTYRLAIEGDNYVLTTFLGKDDSEAIAGGGSFNGCAWGLENGNLIFSDSTINSNRTAVDHQDIVTRMTADLLANLGITELVRSSIAYDSKNLSFVGKDTFGEALEICLDFAGQLPKRAVIHKTLAGGVQGFIDYDYTNTFCSGELPFQFTRHFGSPDDDLGKAFCVTLMAIDVTSSRAVLDPNKLFRARSISFYSNDILYTYNAQGRAERDLTPKEIQALTSALKPSQQKILFVRITIYSVILIGFAVFISSFLINKQNKLE